MRYYVGNFFYGEDLLHYRTAGSKNGVRRYQNPDGSLTPEGRVHYNRPLPKKKRGQSVIDKLFGGKGKSSKKQQTKDKRKLSDMSDEEIKSRTSRKKIENEYLAEVKKGKELRKKKSNEFGKKLAEAALAAGKDMLTSYFKYALDQATANAEAERKRQAEDRKNAREDAKAAREEAEKKKNDPEKEAQEKEKRLYSNKYDRAKDKDLESKAKPNKVASYVNNGRSVVNEYLNPPRSGDSDKSTKWSDKFDQRYDAHDASKQDSDYPEYEHKRNRRGGGEYA